MNPKSLQLFGFMRAGPATDARPLTAQRGRIAVADKTTGRRSRGSHSTFRHRRDDGPPPSQPSSQTGNGAWRSWRLGGYPLCPAGHLPHKGGRSSGRTATVHLDDPSIAGRN